MFINIALPFCNSNNLKKNKTDIGNIAQYKGNNTLIKLHKLRLVIVLFSIISSLLYSSYKIKSHICFFLSSFFVIKENILYCYYKYLTALINLY